MAFDQSKYNANFQRENYYRPTVFIPIAKKTDVQQAAKERGISISQLVIDALEKCYKLDLSK